ncbi:MAG: histidine kinase [Bacteroidales bacterium]|nr:histidine kinase [Bacteroidales bacterium]
MTAKELIFITDLISYKPLSCVFRILFISLIGFLCLFMTVTIADTYELSMPYVSFSIGFVAITEINVFFSNQLPKCPSQKVKEYQFVALILLNAVLIILAVYLFFPWIEGEEVAQNPIVKLAVIFTFLFVVFLILTITLLRILSTYIETQREVEVLRQAQSASEYQALVEQVNPHFLFNNLSVLKSLIMFDKDKAVDFTQNFTDIYRYVLQSKDKDVVLLSDELDFVKSYVALHKERVGEGLQVTYNIPTEILEKSIIPLGLQLLVENALKHNIASKTEPLSIVIYAEDDRLIVKNNLNKKDTAYSTRKGLGNITKRYEILTDKEVLVEQNEKEFIVSLPLI